jgi:hypothetical protein
MPTATKKKPAVKKTAVKKPVAKKAAKKPVVKKANKRNASKHKLAEKKRRALYLEALASGANKAQAAQAAGVTYTSVHRYVDANPSFKDAIEDAILEADRVRVERVEDALYLRAVGYEYKEERVTKDGKVVTVTLMHQPDVVAQIFFLKNRDPERWKDLRDYKVRADIQTQREEKVNHAVEKLTADKKLAEKFLPLLSVVCGDGDPGGRGPSQN